jgi:hypothetical protein
LSDRLRFQSHDFFAEPFPHADVLVMGHVLTGNESMVVGIK